MNTEDDSATANQPSLGHVHGADAKQCGVALRLPPHSKRSSWPHAPSHRLTERGVFMVTCGTYRKEPHLAAAGRKDDFLSRFFALALRFGWRLEAWAVLSNHYHFVAQSPEDPGTLRRMLALLHETTAKAWNREDETPGRKVWFNYWDSRITFERSYLARLKYVHENPVHHGLVLRSVDYPWCSAAWFEEQTTAAFVKTMKGFRTDEVRVRDDF